MDSTASIDPSQFVHVRILLSMVVSLALARLLSGLARFVQHPKRLVVYPVHLAWCVFMLVLLLHFWWWQFALSRLSVWRFEWFAFVIGYAALLYLLCAILLPDDVDEYGGYREYFMSRRKWFFAFLAVTLAVDVVDTWIKGAAYLRSLGPGVWWRAAAGVALCAVAARVASQRFHLAFALLAIAVEVSWILRLYDILQ